MKNGSKIFAKCFDIEWLTRILETANAFPDKQRNTLKKKILNGTVIYKNVKEFSSLMIMINQGTIH